jgi:hypothetical protein
MIPYCPPRDLCSAVVDAALLGFSPDAGDFAGIREAVLLVLGAGHPFTLAGDGEGLFPANAPFQSTGTDRVEGVFRMACRGRPVRLVRCPWSPAAVLCRPDP